MSLEMLGFIALIAVVAFFLGRGVRASDERNSGPLGGPRNRQQKQITKRRATRVSRLENVPVAELFSRLEAQDREQIDAYIADGKLIAAIKLMRESSGVGLKEAKEAVEARKASQSG